MRITPLDIRKQPFRKTVMGFDKDEVNSFLEMVANEFEQIIRQNDELTNKVKVLLTQLEDYQRIEKTLNETLLTAQRATDEARLNAQKEAELIIKDAQLRADRYEDQSRQSVNLLESELNSLKTQRDSFLARFKSMLRDQLALMEVISGSLKDREDGTKKVGRKTTSIKTADVRERRFVEDETMDEVPPAPVV